MPFRELPRKLGRAGLILTLAYAGFLVPTAEQAVGADARAVAAEDGGIVRALPQASVTPGIQFLGDSAGTTFTFTVRNTRRTGSIGAVQISRPGTLWTIRRCPSAPRGWTVRRTASACRYLSKRAKSDDIRPGQQSSAFKVRATTAGGTQNVTGAWKVRVSRTNTLRRRHLYPVAPPNPGLHLTAYAFQVSDVVVDPATSTPGAACPVSNKSAAAASTGHTVVVCGRNRTTGTLTPAMAQSSLAGTFITGLGTFTSGPIAPAAVSRVLGSWSNVTITSPPGTNKTVIAGIGSTSIRTSPLATFAGYTATGTANNAPSALDDTKTVGEDDASATTVNVLANDTDADADTLTVTGVNTTGTDGQVTNNGTDVSYDPNGAFESLGAGETATDTFTYTVSDGHGGADTATVTITITGANDPPNAVADAKTLGEDDGGTTVNVRANDTDADTDTLTVIAVDTTGTDGQVSNNGTDVTYNPNGAFESLNAGDTATDSFTYTVSDGHGGTDTATVTVTVNGADEANNPPVATDDVKTVGEDDSIGTTVSVLANDTDADAHTLTVTGVNTTGTDGQVTNNATFVTYDPNGAFESLGAGQTTTDTFTYTVSDGHGGTDTATVTVTISGANDVPVIAAVEGTDLAYTENGAAAVITATGTVTDPDAGNFDTGTLTIEYSANGQAEDRLAVRNQGTGAGQIGVSGANVTYAGVTIGTVTGGTGTTPLVITFNASSTHAAAQALLRNITYANVSDDPSTLPRTASFEIADGDGGTSVAATRDITVAAVDDAPVAVSDSATLSQDAAATPVPVLANDTDIDDGPKVIASASDPANGTVVLTGGSPGARTGLTYQPDPTYCNDPPLLADTFTYTLNGGSFATVTMSVICGINDPPVIAAIEGTSLGYTENDSATVITTTGTVTDPDSVHFDTGTLTIDYSAGGTATDRLAIRNQGTGAGQIGVAGSNVTYAGVTIGVLAGGTGTAPLVIAFDVDATPAATQALLRNITYANVSENPSTVTRTARFVVTDGDGGTSAPATRQITVAAVNDAPAIAAIEGAALSYTENGAATVITATGTVADADSGNFDTGTLTIDFSANGQAEDRLAIRNQGTGAGQIGVSGANVTFAGVVIGTFAGGTGTTPLVITLNASATPAATQALQRNITYANVSDNPSTATRTARFVLTDGDGGTSTPATRTITVTAANDAPLIAALEAGTLAYTENAAATVITATGTVTDLDSADFNTGTLTVDYSAGGAAEDRLEVRNQGTGAGQIGVSGSNVTFAGVAIGGFTGGTGTTPLVITLNASGTPAATQALLRNITYRNVSENPSTTTRTARLVLTDGDGGTSAPATRSISITAANDAPAIAALEGTALAYTENDPATVITATGTVTDPDSGNFGTGTLTVDYLTGGQPEDRLAIRNQGIGAGQIGVSGANVTFGGVTIGTFTGGTGTTPLVITLNTSATPAATQALLRNLTYANVSENPATATRTVRFVLTDGDGGTSAPVTRDIAITASDDGPVAVADSAGVSEDAAATPVTVLTNDTDIDGGPKVIASATDPANGTVVLTGGAPGAHTGLTYQPDPDYCNTPSGAADTFSYTLNGGNSATVSMTVTCGINVPPVIAAIEAGALAYTENAAATVITATGTITDTDSANFSGGALTVDHSAGGQAEDRLAVRNQGTGAGQIGVSGANVTFAGVLIGTSTGGTGTTPLVITLNASATPAATQALLRNITYADVSDNPSAVTRTARFVLTDGDGGTSTPATRQINVTSTNDAPVIAAIEAGALGYTEGDPATSITATGTVSDIDSANFATGTLTVDYSANGAAEDRLAIRNQGTGAGQIGVSGANVTFAGVLIGTFTGGTGTTPLVVTLNAGATPAATQALLRNITYANVSATPSTATRTARFVLTDGDGGTSAPATRQITVAAAANAPILTTSAGALAHTEGEAAEAIDPALTVTDADSANLAGATVHISGNYVSGEDLLVSTPPGGIIANFNSATGILTLTGSAPVSTYQTALREVRYQNLSEAPSTLGRTIVFQANDGSVNSNAAVKSIVVTAVNDAPAISAIEAGALTWIEGDPPTVITATGAVADVDSADFAAGTLTADFSAGGTANDRLEIRNQGTGAGQIGVSGANVTFGGVLIGTFTGGVGTTPLVITLNASATQPATQALLRNLTYRNVSNAPAASRTARFVLTDGDGGTSAPVTRAITVTPVNDAPTIAAIEAAALLYVENDAATVITATGTVADADSADLSTGTLTVDYSANGAAEDRLAVRNQGTGAGQIGVAGANVSFAGTTIGTFTGGTGTTPLVITLNASATPAAAQALLRNITYANVSNTPSALTRTMRFVLTDGDGGTSNAATRDITVMPIDDGPVLTASAGSTAYTEQAAAVAVDAGLNATDVDGGANVTGAVVTVTAPLAGDTVHFTTQNGITGNYSAPVLTLSGSATLAQYQTALRTVGFSNPSNDAPGTSRTISLQIVGFPASNSVNKNVTITQVNDPPVVFLDMAGPLPYTEQAGFVNLFGPVSTITDPDSTVLDSITVTISTGFNATFDSLRLNPAVTGFNVDLVGNTLTITRIGGTVAQFQDALRNVQFSNTSNDPDSRNDGTANPVDADRTFTVVVDDGAANGATPPLPRLLSITPVNDAPGAPGTLPTTAGVHNTTLVSGTTTTEPNVVRTVNFIGTATDPDGLESAITVVPVAAAATAQGGRITLASDGDLNYEPPASASLASDTYGYALTDGTTSSTPITFTVNLSGAVWYVADQAAGAQDGTAARPFATIAGALAVAGANQAIHLRRAPGDGILTAGVTLQAGQKLLGEGVALTNTDVGSATAETIYAAGTKPVLTAVGSDVITLASNVQVAGVSINPDGAGGGLFGNATAGVTLRAMDVIDTGAAATQPGIELTGAGNGLTFTAPVSLSTTQAGALNVTGAVLAGTLASTTVTGSTTSPGVSLTNTTGSLTFTTTAITTTNQPGFVLNNATNIDVTSGGVASTNRAAVDATGLAAGSDLTFTDVDSTNSTGDGVNLDGTDTAWTFSTGSGSTIVGAAGIGFDLNNGSSAITFPGSIDATGKAVEVTSRAVNTTFSGNLSVSGTAGGIAVDGNTAGTTTFSGATKSLSTGTVAAVNLTNNTGATIAFINGGLAITSTSGAGFNATGGGTVTVAGTGNTISTTTGTGLNIAGTTIGAANVTFQSISSNGAANGIALTNTGSAGIFNVTGTAAVDSGGIIQNTTGVGILLTNADAISLNRVKLLGTDRSGIQGVGVTGFSLTNSTITNAGDTHVNDNDSAIAFNDTSTGLNNNVDGAVTITGNTLTNPFGAGIEIFQYAGTISDAVITGNTISSSFDPALSRRSGIALNLFGSTTTVASLTKGNISNNTVTGFPSGDGISLQGANTASATAPAGTYGTPGSATNIVTFTGNQVIGDTTNKINGFGIAASVTGRGQGNFSITNNGTVGSPLRNMKSSAVAIGVAGDVTAYFVVTGNQINANNGFSTAGIALGTDKNIQADLNTLSNPVVRATISNNAISNTSGSGIRILHRSSNGTANLRVENNAITNVVNPGPGIRLENGSSADAAFNPTMCASISGNNTQSGPADGFGDKNPGINLYKSSALSTTYVFGLTGLAPSPATNAQVETHVTGLNPLSATGAGFFAGKKVAVRTGSNYTSCTLPAGM